MNPEEYSYLKEQYGLNVAENYRALTSRPLYYYSAAYECKRCGGEVKKDGKDKKSGRQRYRCKVCRRRQLA